MEEATRSLEKHVRADKTRVDRRFLGLMGSPVDILTVLLLG